MNYEKHYQARNIIEDILKKDLIGPVEEDEIIEGPPQQYYAMGILFPQKSLLSGEEDMEDNDEDLNAGIKLSNSYNPSSIALSTTISNCVSKLKVTIKFARYEQLIDEQKDNEYSPVKWKRIPYEIEKIVEIPLYKESMFLELENNLSLEVHIQMVFDDNSKTITVALVNNNTSENFVIDNRNTFFQPLIHISSIDEQEEIFRPRKQKLDINIDEEIKTFDMLYSHINNYAVGHGCSVNWDEGKKYARAIYSEIIPGYELKQLKPAFKANKDIFRIKFLANSSLDSIVKKISEFVTSYDEWISEEENNIQKLDEKFETVATNNIKRLRETRDRINEAIKLFENDPNVFRAFQLTNRAMYEQRKKYLSINGKTVNDDNITWYPFQLAYILQVLPSVVNPKSKYRDIVDLLWFPTGGGKTEAYLGLAAFSIFYRRLTSTVSGGVNVIMRYTLRLLTIQQFERAAALVASCELIRLSENLGGEEISIGLWVGGGLTPNDISKARDNLLKVRKNEDVREGNPCQLHICPWCGAEITSANYNYENDRHSIYCSSKSCEFYHGLPIYLVDEEIYKYKPTFIISTIDKFARMTWEPKVGEIFGIDSEYDPPDLIIQDELHLISGPLGTISGLYEIAIKKFTEKNGIHAKIIASTATIRNAKEQINALYGKDFRQFPPQGLNIRDSYFAEESTIEEKPGRRYLGIITPGKSSTTMLVRVYASLLFATRYLADNDFSDEVIDSFWTIVGYFNSLRELGGALRQVVDDVQDRYKFLYNTKFKNITPKFEVERNKTFDFYEELTSRKPNSKITEIIQKNLKVKYPNTDSLHFVLASNMISVGVDVDRLSLMAVTGQPKTNAEYIQATSRVGRSTPGLVVDMLSASKSRDRSHYEQYLYYHSALYKFVEATSITPFSDRAREKALDAVFISLCRNLITELKSNDSAGNFVPDNEEVDKIEEYIIDYARKVDDSELNSLVRELNEIKKRWYNLAAFFNDVSYAVYGQNQGVPLLKNKHDEAGEFLVLNSMRNIDLESTVYIKE